MKGPRILCVLLFTAVILHAGVVAARAGLMVCRPDDRTRVVYRPAEGWLRIEGLRPAPTAAALRAPGPGRCAFADRPVAADARGGIVLRVRWPADAMRHITFHPYPGSERPATFLAADAERNRLVEALQRGRPFRVPVERRGRGEFEVTGPAEHLSSPAPRRPPREVPPHDGFEPVPAPSGVHCEHFDPARLRVHRRDGHWALTVDGRVLLDFGRRHDAAHRALRVLEHYAADTLCRIGRPGDDLMYILRRGSAPTGAMPGEDCLPFSPLRVRVRRIEGRWKLVDGARWLFDFGSDETAARRAARLVREHGFTRSCFVGRPGPVFGYLRR